MTLTMDDFYGARIFLVVSLGILATIQDIRYHKIPNRLLVSFLLLGIIAWCLGQGVMGLWFSLAPSLLAYVVLAPLFMLRALGGGDIKLYAVIAGITGVELFVPIFFLSLLAGGLVGFLIWLRRRPVLGRRQGPVFGGGRFESEGVSHGITLQNDYFPFALPILIGILLGVLAEGQLPNQFGFL